MMFLFRRDSLLHSPPSQIRRMQIHGLKIGLTSYPRAPKLGSNVYLRRPAFWSGKELAMFWRKRKTSDFRDEIESHLQLEVERLREQGLSEKDARAAARRAFGNVTQAQERFYESPRWLWWDHLCQDLRFAFRMLRKSPGFAVLAALCLALGTGVNTSVFALLDFTMLRPLPVPKPNRMTLLSRSDDDRFSYPDYLAYRDRGQTFAELAASFPTESSLDVKDQSHLVSAEAVSANYFKTMGIAPFIGRWLTDERK